MNAEKELVRSVHLLVAEDSDDDYFLTEECFRRSRLKVSMARVINGEECLKYLRKSAPYEDVERPDLLLLDLNMPIMDGRDVLAEIVNDADLCHLPTVVLTTSEREEDVLDMYRLRCSSYIRKPASFNRFSEVITDLGLHWFALVSLPLPDEQR